MLSRNTSFLTGLLTGAGLVATGAGIFHVAYTTHPCQSLFQEVETYYDPRMSLTKRIKNRLDLMRSISRKHIPASSINIMNCDIIKDNVVFGRVYHPKEYDYIHGVMIRDNFSYGNKDWTFGDNLAKTAPAPGAVGAVDANEEKKIVLFTLPNYAKCYTNGEKQTFMVDAMKVLAILVCK